MDITINYTLTGLGWSKCALDVNGQSCVVTASYLSDAFYKLLNGVNKVLSGEHEARFSFDEEPGEYRWIIGRMDAHAISIRILEFPDLWEHGPDSEGKLIFDVACPTRDFAQALLLSANNMLTEYGLDGYKAKWDLAEFPLTEYKTLCLHLSVSPSY